MDTSHQHAYLSHTRYRRHVYNKDAHSHHTYCRKTSVSKYVRSSRLSVHPMGLAPPEDSSVVTRGLPAHPAAVLPGLISQAHAGSTWAANKHIIQFCVLYFIHIPHEIILKHVFFIKHTSVQWSSESEACSLCFLDELVVLLLPTELFIEWRTLMRWLRGTVTCDHMLSNKLWWNHMFSTLKNHHYHTSYNHHNKPYLLGIPMPACIAVISASWCYKVNII